MEGVPPLIRPNRHQKLTAIFVLIFFTLYNGLEFAPSGFAQGTARRSSLRAHEVGVAISGSGIASSPPERTAVPRNDGITIPPELGTVDEFHAGTNGKTIFYIQDAHDSLEAQEHIAKIISHLVDKENVGTVFEEGYEGPVPTDEYFGFIQDSKVKEKVSYFLMDKLRIGGAEYAHINRFSRLSSPHALSGNPRSGSPIKDFGDDKKHVDFKLIGIDNIEFHLENIRAYRRNAKRKAETDRDFNVLLKELEALANRYFPKELKKWMKLKEKFDRHEVDLMEYLRQAFVIASLPATNLGGRAKQSQVQRLPRRPDGLPPGLSTRKVGDLAMTDKSYLPFPNLSLLLQAERTQDARLLEQIKSIDARAFFREIDRMDEEFVNAVIMSENILSFPQSVSGNPLSLGSLPESINRGSRPPIKAFGGDKRHYFGDDRNRRLYRYLKHVQLLKRLNQIELTPSEYEGVKHALRRLNTKALARFIVRHTGKSIVLSKKWEWNIRDAVSFYETARKREKILDVNLKQFSEHTPSPFTGESFDRLRIPSEVEGDRGGGKNETAILVFGGFHAEKIKEILNKLHFSYAVISPKITGLDFKHHEYYKRLMSVGHHAFEAPFHLTRASRAETTFLQARTLGEAPVEAELRTLAEIIGQNAGLETPLLHRQIESALSHRPPSLPSGRQAPGRRLVVGGRPSTPAELRNESVSKGNVPSEMVPAVLEKSRLTDEERKRMIYGQQLARWENQGMLMSKRSALYLEISAILTKILKGAYGLSPDTFRLDVLLSDGENAFIFRDERHIVITRGLLRGFYERFGRLTEDHIAFVLFHEIAHYVKGSYDAAKRAEQETREREMAKKRIWISEQIKEHQAARPPSRLLEDQGEVAASLMFENLEEQFAAMYEGKRETNPLELLFHEHIFDHRQEYQADHEAILRMDELGWSARASLEAIDYLIELERTHSSFRSAGGWLWNLSILRTHPPSARRLQEMEGAIRFRHLDLAREPKSLSIAALNDLKAQSPAQAALAQYSPEPGNQRVFFDDAAKTRDISLLRQRLYLHPLLFPAINKPYADLLVRSYYWWSRGTHVTLPEESINPEQATAWANAIEKQNDALQRSQDIEISRSYERLAARGDTLYERLQGRPADPLLQKMERFFLFYGDYYSARGTALLHEITSDLPGSPFTLIEFLRRKFQFHPEYGAFPVRLWNEQARRRFDDKWARDQSEFDSAEQHFVLLMLDAILSEIAHDPEHYFLENPNAGFRFFIELGSWLRDRPTTETFQAGVRFGLSEFLGILVNRYGYERMVLEFEEAVRATGKKIPQELLSVPLAGAVSEFLHRSSGSRQDMELLFSSIEQLMPEPTLARDGLLLRTAGHKKVRENKDFVIERLFRMFSDIKDPDEQNVINYQHPNYWPASKAMEFWTEALAERWGQERQERVKSGESPLAVHVDQLIRWNACPVLMSVTHGQSHGVSSKLYEDFWEVSDFGSLSFDEAKTQWKRLEAEYQKRGFQRADIDDILLTFFSFVTHQKFFPGKGLPSLLKGADEWLDRLENEYHISKRRYSKRFLSKVKADLADVLEIHSIPEDSRFGPLRVLWSGQGFYLWSRLIVRLLEKAVDSKDVVLVRKLASLLHAPYFPGVQFVKEMDQNGADDQSIAARVSRGSEKARKVKTLRRRYYEFLKGYRPPLKQPVSTSDFGQGTGTEEIELMQIQAKIYDFLRRKAGKKISDGQNRALIFEAFTFPSPERDRRLLKWLEKEGAPPAAELRSSERISSILPHLSSLSARLTLGHEGFELARKEHPERFKTLVTELNSIVTFFPDPSPARDQYLDQLVETHVQTEDDYRHLQDLYMRREELTAGRRFALFHSAVMEGIRDAVESEEVSPAERVFTFLWMLGAVEKPHVIEVIEQGLGYQADQVQKGLESMTDYERRELIRTILVGERGILTSGDRSVQRLFFAFVFRMLVGQHRDLNEPELARFYLFFSTLFHFLDDERKVRTLTALFESNLKEGMFEERVKVFVEALGYVGIKTAQYLANNTSLLSPKMREQFIELTSRVRPPRRGDLFQLLRETFHYQDFSDYFRAIGKSPGSASLNVAYEAVLWDGTEVVLLIQRADVVQGIRQALDQAADVGMMIAELPVQYGFPISRALIPRIWEQTLLEMDNVRMVENLKRLRADSAGWNQDPNEPIQVTVPRVLEEHKGKQLTAGPVVTIEKANGLTLDEAEKQYGREALQPFRKRLAKVLIRQVFRDQFFHADPHPGNLIVDYPNRVISLIDAGITSSFSTQNRKAFLGLLEVVLQQTASRYGMSAEVFGFRTLDKTEIRARLRNFIAANQKAPDVSKIDRALNDFLGRHLSHLSRLADVVYEVIKLFDDHNLNLDQEFFYLFRMLSLGEPLFAALTPMELIEELKPYLSSEAAVAEPAGTIQGTHLASDLVFHLLTRRQVLEIFVDDQLRLGEMPTLWQRSLIHPSIIRRQGRDYFMAAEINLLTEGMEGVLELLPVSESYELAFYAQDQNFFRKPDFWKQLGTAPFMPGMEAISLKQLFRDELARKARGELPAALYYDWGKRDFVPVTDLLIHMEDISHFAGLTAELENELHALRAQVPVSFGNEGPAAELRVEGQEGSDADSKQPKLSRRHLLIAGAVSVAAIGAGIGLWRLLKSPSKSDREKYHSDFERLGIKGLPIQEHPEIYEAFDFQKMFPDSPRKPELLQMLIMFFNGSMIQASQGVRPSETARRNEKALADLEFVFAWLIQHWESEGKQVWHAVTQIKPEEMRVGGVTYGVEPRDEDRFPGVYGARIHIGSLTQKEWVYDGTMDRVNPEMTNRIQAQARKVQELFKQVRIKHIEEQPESQRSELRAERSRRKRSGARELKRIAEGPQIGRRDFVKQAVKLVVVGAGAYLFFNDNRNRPGRMFLPGRVLYAAYGSHETAYDAQDTINEIERAYDLAPMNPRTGQKHLTYVFEYLLHLNYAKIIRQKLYLQNLDTVHFLQAAKDDLKLEYEKELTKMRRNRVGYAQRILEEELKEYRESNHPRAEYFERILSLLKRPGIKLVFEELDFETWYINMMAMAKEAFAQKQFFLGDRDAFLNAFRESQDLYYQSISRRAEAVSRFIENLFDENPNQAVFLHYGIAHYLTHDVISNGRFRSAEPITFEYLDHLPRRVRLYFARQAGKPIPEALYYETLVEDSLVHLSTLAGVKRKTVFYVQLAQQIIDRIRGAAEGFTEEEQNQHSLVRIKRLLDQVRSGNVQTIQAGLTRLLSALFDQGYVRYDELSHFGASFEPSASHVSSSTAPAELRSGNSRKLSVVSRKPGESQLSELTTYDLRLKTLSSAEMREGKQVSGVRDQGSGKAAFSEVRWKIKTGRVFIIGMLTKGALGAVIYLAGQTNVFQRYFAERGGITKALQGIQYFNAGNLISFIKVYSNALGHVLGGYGAFLKSYVESVYLGVISDPHFASFISKVIDIDRNDNDLRAFFNEYGLYLFGLVTLSVPYFVIREVLHTLQSTKLRRFPQSGANGLDNFSFIRSTVSKLHSGVIAETNGFGSARHEPTLADQFQEVNSESAAELRKGAVITGENVSSDGQTRTSGQLLPEDQTLPFQQNQPSFPPLVGGTNKVAMTNSTTTNNNKAIFPKIGRGTNHPDTNEAPNVISEKRYRDLDAASRFDGSIMPESVPETMGTINKNNQVFYDERQTVSAAQEGSGQGEEARQIERALDSWNVPVVAMVDYEDLVHHFSEDQRNEIFAYAFMNPEQVNVVIYNAAADHKDLNPFRELSRNVRILKDSAEAAYAQAYKDYQKGIQAQTEFIHLSKSVSRLKEQFSETARSEIYFFRYRRDDAQNGLLAAALLYLIYAEAGRRLDGIERDGEGYFTMVGEFLRNALRLRYADLVVQLAA